MIYSALEYSKIFRFCGDFVSAMTIKRRCKNGLLKPGHVATKLPGKTGGWIIEVPDRPIQPIIKDKKSSMSTGSFHW